MQTPQRRDRSLRNTILISLLALAVGFGATWAYLQYQQYRQTLDARVSFITLPRVAISRDGHSMAATVALRTSGSDAGWIGKQQRALEEVVKIALMEADPVQSRGPQGLPQLQEKIRERSNALLETDRVREVLITDFLVSEGDY